MYQEFRKTATVKAKVFEKGDEDGMTTPENFTMLDAMENEKYRCVQPDLVPYISTLENQKHHGEFEKQYLCIGVKGEKWLVDKDIFEQTYESVSINEPSPADESDPVYNDAEKAAYHYGNLDRDNYNHRYPAFVAGTKWQSAQLEKRNRELYTVLSELYERTKFNAQGDLIEATFKKVVIALKNHEQSK